MNEAEQFLEAKMKGGQAVETASSVPDVSEMKAAGDGATGTVREDDGRVSSQGTSGKGGPKRGFLRRGPTT